MLLELLCHSVFGSNTFLLHEVVRCIYSSLKYFKLSQMWPDLIAKSKEGGADVIQTYVFWNGHEPVRGQVNPLIMVQSDSCLGWLSWIIFISFYLHISFHLSTVCTVQF